MTKLTKSFKDTLTEIAIKQFKNGYNFKKRRMAEIRKNEEFYNLRKIVVPRGRFAVPLPVMSGFVDALISKIDEPPASKYTSEDIADLKRLGMVSLAFEKETAPIRLNYAQKDRWSKKLACFSGRGIMKTVFGSNPYSSSFSVVDYEDFITEPSGGGDLNLHLFHGQDGIIKTKYDLKNDRSYSNVKKLIDSAGSEDKKKVTDSFYNQKYLRYKSLGLDITNNSYVGQTVFKLVEWIMKYQGSAYYLLFHLETGTWVRVEKLSGITTSGLSPFTSWATHEDHSIFWSKAPCDDIRPIADTAELLLNQELYNRSKANMGQRAFDAGTFKDPAQLAWRPDGLVEGTPKPGKTLASGIYEFQTRELRGTIDLLQFLDFYGSQKTGVTPGMSQVPEKDQRVGIRFANMQDMADRLGLFNKSYRKAQDEIAQRYYHGVIENLPEKDLIKMIGEKGAGWDAIKNSGSVDFDIELVGGSAEVQANAEKEARRMESLTMIMKDETLIGAINPMWRLKQVLIQGGWDENQIKGALSQGDISDNEIIGEAALAIQDILQDKKPKRIIRNASVAFLQYLSDFADDMEFDMNSTKTVDVKAKKHYAEIMQYAERHLRVVEENMARKASGVLSLRAETGQKEGDTSTLNISENLSIKEPIAGSSQSGIKQGVEATNILSGKTAPAV